MNYHYLSWTTSQAVLQCTVLTDDRVIPTAQYAACENSVAAKFSEQLDKA